MFCQTWTSPPPITFWPQSDFTHHGLLCRTLLPLLMFCQSDFVITHHVCHDRTSVRVGLSVYLYLWISGIATCISQFWWLLLTGILMSKRVDRVQHVKISQSVCSSVLSSRPNMLTAGAVSAIIEAFVINADWFFPGGEWTQILFLLLLLLCQCVYSITPITGKVYIHFTYRASVCCVYFLWGKPLLCYLLRDFVYKHLSYIWMTMYSLSIYLL